MIAVSLAGAAVGLVLALTGAGGGIVAVPLLVFGAGMTMAQAGPVALIAVAIGATMGALLGLKAGIVRYRAALVLAISGMAATPAGIWLAQRTDNRWLAALFAGVLAHVAWKSWRREATVRTAPPRPPSCVRDSATGRLRWNTRCARAMLLSGGLAGLLSGLLGVGGGFVVVPALRRCTDLPIGSIVATSLGVVALISLNGAAIGLAGGNMPWQVAAPFCAGTLGGMCTGRAIAARIPGPVISRLFATLAALIAAALLFRVFRHP